MAKYSDVMSVVLENMRKAVLSADRIELAEDKKFAASGGLLGDAPRYRELQMASAEKAEATILFVDMRGSTERAIRLGARSTFVTMHGLVPALAFLVSECGGYVVGYRGDGLIAAFGIDEFAHEKAISDNGRFVQEAACCGQAMLETVDGIVNILLEAWKIPGDVRIGVGIDVGQVVITRIGLQGAYDTTVYGNAVNHAAKLCKISDGGVLISPGAERIYPRSPTGTATITPVSSDPPGVKISFQGPQLQETPLT